MATEWTFERAMGRLEQIVAALEGGRCTLDEAMKLFEEGAKLTSYCTRALQSAQQKILKLAEPIQGADTAATESNAGTDSIDSADVSEGRE